MTMKKPSNSLRTICRNDAQPDEEGYINIDQDEIVNYIIKESAEDGMGPYEPDDVFFVVQGEMEYGNQLGGIE